MDEEISIQPDLIPESEWDDDEDWGTWGSWKASENKGWNDEEYGGCGGCDDDAPLPPLTTYANLAGSASKWKPDEYAEMLGDLMPTFAQEESLGMIDGDDSVIMRVNDGQAIVFSIDWFTPVVDDYYKFGAISAASALSGLYATGVKPITALNVMALPCKMGVDVVGEVVRGGSDKVIEAGAFVVGGHSVDDNIPKYGLATFGLAPADKVIRNERTAVGDVLFYTKPLGTGIVVEAFLAELETEESMQGTIDSMLELNKAAADVMADFDVHGAIRVAEQGLAGEVHDLMELCGCAAEVQWSQIQLHDRVWEHCLAGCVPSRGAETAGWAYGFIEMGDGFVDGEVEEEARMCILCDPQTSGGLLIALPEDEADAFTTAFEKAAGHPAFRIGRVVEGDPGSILVQP